MDYAVCGNYEGLPEYTSNDIDIWVSDTNLAYRMLADIANEEKFDKYLCNQTANGSNNYFYRETAGTIDLIKIDLMHETAWCSVIPLVTRRAIESNRIKWNGFYIVNKDIEGVMHLLYPLVTWGKVVEKYKADFVELLNSTIFKNELATSVGNSTARTLEEIISHRDWETLSDSQVRVKKSLIFRLISNIDLYRLRAFVLFPWFLIVRLIQPQGLVIALTGLDGVGKSTLKKRLVKDAVLYFPKRRLMEYYWRPFVLPRIARLFGSVGQEEEIDNEGRRVLEISNSALFKSYIKYFYYIFDYVLGRVRDLKCLCTGGLIIYDRYHIDCMVYPERFGFKVNTSFMRWVDRFVVPKPDIVFYLKADTREMLKRKQELGKEEIERQKLLYKINLATHHDVIEIDTNKSIDYSYDQIVKNCLKFMAERQKI